MSQHHVQCPYPWERCTCRRLWAEREREYDPDGVAYSYGRFYDPDFDSGTLAEDEPYGGWSRSADHPVSTLGLVVALHEGDTS